MNETTQKGASINRAVERRVGGWAFVKARVKCVILGSSSLVTSLLPGLHGLNLFG